MWIFILITLFAFLMVTTIIGHFALQKAQTVPAYQPARQPVHTTTVAAHTRPAKQQAPRSTARKRAKSGSMTAVPTQQAPATYATTVDTTAEDMPMDEPPPVDTMEMHHDDNSGFQVLDDSFLDFSQRDYEDINRTSMDESSFNVSGNGNDENI